MGEIGVYYTMAENNKKVAIYARVSTDKQELQNQLNQLREYCKKNNYEIFKEYTDIASGANDKRLGFEAMFQDAHKKLFDIVLFWDISRFSRSGTLYTLQKLKELDNLDIKWHSYNESYFSSLGAFKDVVLSIMATLAKIEREKISERTKAGLERAKALGREPGRPRKDPAIYNHYCVAEGCRVKVEQTRRLCFKHRKQESTKRGD